MGGTTHNQRFMRAIVLLAVFPHVLSLTYESLVAQIAPYPGFAGSARGQLVISSTGPNSVTVTGSVVGLPKDCHQCGIHVHEGFTCAGSGGHFFEAVPDPWAKTNYTSDSFGVASISFTAQVAFPSLVGRALVLHNTQVRVACGLLLPFGDGANVAFTALSPPPIYESGLVVVTPIISRYPGYTGSRTPQASIAVQEGTGRNLTYTFEVLGLEAQTNGRFSVNVGQSCASDQAVGGSFFDAALFSTDPWASVTFTTDIQGAARGTIEVDDGFDLLQHADRSVVIFDSVGDRVACSFLVFAPNVEGFVTIAQVGTAIEVFVNIQNLEKHAGPTVGSLHVHEGTSCLAPGLHLLRSDGFDPWSLTQSYTVDPKQLSEQGKARSRATVTVEGYTLASVNGHTFTIHSSNDQTIACGLLSAPPQAAAAPTPTPDTTTDEEGDGGNDNNGALAAGIVLIVLGLLSIVGAAVYVRVSKKRSAGSKVDRK
eukprot:c52301_g1_i1.p1 GENE.c52301_g1_i1~~c52301_g1_i1.p1  ORF type:complete len:483 (+),score=78.90 c52301_g1_i1:1-1449(+)